MTNDREAAYIREVWRNLYCEASERGDEASMARCALQIRKLDERLERDERDAADAFYRVDLPNSAVWSCAVMWGGAWLMLLGASCLLAFSLFSLFSSVV